MDTRGEQSGANREPQEERKHPPEWERDLNPAYMAGQNIGGDEVDREVPIRTAYDIKELHRELRDFANDELKQIPILPNGARLQQGATYVDLAATPRAEFKTTGGLTAYEGHFYVPKDRVPYTIWNRLIGEPKPGQG
jgi:hypothetical protein